jgi:hypothetical protein
MSKVRSFAGCIVFFCLLISVGSFTAFSQTTIFNIPSTDVVERKLFYVEADFITNFKSFEKDGFQTYGYRTVYGAKRNFEIGTNFFYTRTGGGSPKEFQPNFKWKSYSNETYGVEMSTGAILFVPLNRSAGSRPFGMIYSNASKTVPRAGGMKLTGGMYTALGTKSDFGTQFGAIVGIEQPIKGKLSFIGDWYSGKNQFGYSAAGFNFEISTKQSFSAGYNFSNTNRANNAFSAFYSYTF